MSYFPPYIHIKNKIKNELDFPKSYLKNATDVDTSQFAKLAYLANLKSGLDKLDIDKLFELDADKLKPVLTDLNELSDVVKIDIVKKKCYNAKIQKNEDKMSSFINVATYPALDAKINKVKGEIPSITNSATTTALTTVQKKIPKFSDLVKKSDYDAEVKDIKNKYFTTSDYNKFINNILDAKIMRKKLVNESGVNEKIKTLATK